MTIPAGNNAPGASGTGPVSRYNLKLCCFILLLSKIVLILNTCTCYLSLTIVIEILLIYLFIFGIKMYPKLPNSLTYTSQDKKMVSCFSLVYIIKIERWGYLQRKVFKYQHINAEISTEERYALSEIY